uniref:Reverse transcriptase zinc-binding domain-containing protein n=1 Tax=Ananas comosus var. bracteatus TaxID=296719 RepID=A0A6V7P8Y5_ANACO|nr:unnamed protein product [Ananas comosus var. bracteatus]
MCVLCADKLETVDHLLVECVVTKYLFIPLLDDPHVSTSFEDVISVWEELAEKRSLGDSTKALTFVAATWWSIWRARNNIIFRNLPMNAISTAHGIRVLALEWTDFCQTG